MAPRRIFVGVLLMCAISILSKGAKARVIPSNCAVWKTVFPGCLCVAATDEEGNEISFPAVDCSSQSLTSVPVPLKQPDFGEVLYEFRLNDNQLTTLGDNAFHGIKIRHLNLTGNSLGDIDDNAFRNTEDTLTKLSIQGNSTGAPQKNALKWLTKLEELMMKNYRVPHLDGSPEQGYFISFGNLRKLTLDNWGLESIDPHTFITATNRHTLRSLTLINQNLHYIPVDVLREPELQNLLTLQISHTKIHEIFIGAFSFLNQVKEINLSNNEINSIDVGSFRDVGDTLEKLDISHNFLGSTGTEDLQHLDGLFNLRHLILEHNELPSLPKMQNLGSGRHISINLRRNKITKLLDNELASYNERLGGLDLSENFIAEIDDQFFSGATVLKSLTLSYQSGVSATPLAIPSSLAQAANSLTYLNLSGITPNTNTLWQIVGQLVKLETLILHSAQLTTVPDSAFVQLLNLRELDLRYNGITRLSDKTLIGPNNLNKLLLRSNNIAIIPSCLFYQNTNSQISLDLGLNPITCSTSDCDVKKLLEISLNGAYVYPDHDSEPRCADGHLLMSMDPTQFSCDNPRPCTSHLTASTSTNSQSTFDRSLQTQDITLQVLELGTTNINVSWDISNETTGLHYFRLTVSSNSSSKNVDVSNLSASARFKEIEGLTPNTSYTICLQAIFTSGNPMSKCELVSTQTNTTTEAPSTQTPIMTLQVLELGTDSMKIAWDINENTGLRHYKLTISSQTPSQNLEHNEVPASTSHRSVQGLAADTHYTICVQAFFTSRAPVSKCNLQRTQANSTANPLEREGSSN